MKKNNENFTNQKNQHLNQINKNNIDCKELLFTNKSESSIINTNIHQHQQNETTDSSNEIQSVSSTLSLGFFDLENIYDDISRPVITNEFQPNLFVVENDYLYDTYCLVITCNVHHKIALQELPNKCLFLPVISVDTENDSFLKLFQDFIANSFPNAKNCFSDPQLIHQWRIKQPNKETFYNRFIFKTQIISDNVGHQPTLFDYKKCCSDTKKIFWYDLFDFEKYFNPLYIPSGQCLPVWGSEPYQILKAINMNDNDLIWNNLIENQFEDLLDNTTFMELMDIVNYDHDDLKTIYNAFLLHCYPSDNLTFISFVVFIFKLSLYDYFPLKKLRLLYNSFKNSHPFGLKFEDLITGIALMENISENNAHFKLINDKRSQYLFRYYDFDADQLLNYEQFSSLINDYCQNVSFIDMPNMMGEKARSDHIRAFMKKFKDNSLRQSELENALQDISNLSLNVQLVWNALIKLPFDVINWASAKYCYQKVFYERVIYFSSSDKFLKCKLCGNINFSLSNQLVNLLKIGEISDIVTLKSFLNRPQNFFIEIPESDIYLLANDILIRLQRLAIYLFNDELDFSDDTLLNWFFSNQSEMFESIRLILQTTSEILAKEKRVISIKSPCYVFGDLHGNFKDLISYLQIFWKASPFFNTGKYLFLGDYVDRGNWGIEVVIFLFCTKIMAPNNFFLLRGNHEIREVQRQFSFYNECANRLSIQLWDMINDCFDQLPVAAVIDNRLYCAHGGIPASVDTIAQILDAPVLMNDPYLQSIESWEIFWNDPINSVELSFLSESERDFTNSSKGFARNIKRGTAYLFSEEAVDNFCEKNSIEYIIRAHEVYQEGFYFYAHGKVITIFSSSKYSFLDNLAAVLFVSDNKLRIIKIEINE